MPKIVLHHLTESRSDRVAWLLEELGLEYEVTVYVRGPTRAAPPALKKINPLGKAPVVQVDDVTLFETGAICDYLASHFAHAALEDVPSADSVFWSHFAEGSLMAYLQGDATVGATSRVFASGQLPGVELGDEGRQAVQAYAKWYSSFYVKSNVQPQLDLVETFLAAHPAGYFSGGDKPGLGDFLMFFPLNSLFHGTRRANAFTLGPHTGQWVERVRARPACQKALARLEKEEGAAKAKM